MLPENEEDAKDMTYHPIVHRKEESMYNHSYRAGNYSRFDSKSFSFIELISGIIRKSLFGIPFVLSVPKSSKLTYDRLYELLYIQIQRFLANLPKNKIVKTSDDLLPLDTDKNSDGDEKEEEPEPESESEEENLQAPQNSEVKSRNEDSSSEEEKLPTPTLKKKRKALLSLYN